jgi:hypothetical protein
VLIVHSMWWFFLHVEMIFVMYLFSYSHWITMESINILSILIHNYLIGHIYVHL